MPQIPMPLPGAQVELTNWSRSARSTCYIYPVCDTAGIRRALETARAQGLSVIPHGAGHSYTDAALNTGGVVIDVTPMRQVLAWDAAQGILRVEPGVTLREIVQLAGKEGWWPFVCPSTPEATVGGCAAMNVNGRNAWKWGPFGASILSLDVMLASGEVCTLTPERDAQPFHAFVGSSGLLGVITSVTLQLQHIPSGSVIVRRRSAASLDEIFTLFAEEGPHSDFMEAWLDGFAHGDRLGRGHLTCGALDLTGEPLPGPFSLPGDPRRAVQSLVRLGASLGRPVLQPVFQIATLANYGWNRWRRPAKGQPRALYPFNFWPAAAFAGYPALFPGGVETFQAFVPGEHAPQLFRQVLRYSQEKECWPVWSIIKQHRRDPFLLSYQLDGFSLELNYARTPQTAETLPRVLQHMIAMVIEAGGRFYLAKDHFLTHAQYRQSVGDAAVDTFLSLKQSLDPEMRLQSDLFWRIFQTGSR